MNMCNCGAPALLSESFIFSTDHKIHYCKNCFADTLEKRNEKRLDAIKHWASCPEEQDPIGMAKFMEIKERIIYYEYKKHAELLRSEKEYNNKNITELHDSQQFQNELKKIKEQYGWSRVTQEAIQLDRLGRDYIKNG